ncbi:hypothetical protein BUALT_Bualt04G0037600 [Buddleja alternifolia]|uniref:Zinc knuckle CX2CX4HX4C domain-containing protein n=1 Tax=Buddleja alternifolia TaxID=168488 RepID=A0AAV6XKZ9_9LAMI|nr:hypothetical protein BUALT_Bualt04G0037600 [Buddleja alternifolia]
MGNHRLCQSGSKCLVTTSLVPSTIPISHCKFGGKAVEVRRSYNGANPMVARMCVEINVLEKLQPDIPIQINGKTFFFKVQYEGIPQYCKICRHRGHAMSACYLRKENNEDDSKKKSTEKVANVEDLREKLNKKRGAGTLKNESKEDDGQNLEKSLTASTSGTKKVDGDVVPETPNSAAASKNDTKSRRVVIDGQNYNVLMHAKDPSNVSLNRMGNMTHKGYMDDMRRERELEAIESPLTNEGTDHQDIFLGEDVEVPYNDGLRVDSEDTESDIP